MTNSLTISIALCTYNGERFLQEQLDSIANQTRLPDEVVVGDDGSTDKTLEILEKWARMVPFPVKITKNTPNLGPAKNFEQTMLRCQGDIIFLCDQDDIWVPEKLEKMTDIFEKHSEVGLVYCYADTVDGNGENLGISRALMTRSQLIKDGWTLFSPFCCQHDNMIGCCSAIRSPILSKIFPLTPEEPHDVEIFLRSATITELYTLRKNLTHYRLHHSNTSLHTDWRVLLNEFLLMSRTAWKWLPGVYFLLEEKIQKHQNWLETVPESPYKQRCLQYVLENQKHYPNRDRIQRNFFIFFPLFFVELFSLRYFKRYQPFRSMAYDVAVGIWNGLNPIKTGKMIISVFRKILDKIGGKS